ncbi:MAG: glycosyltransferase [Deltaproteobacteria bacterium]|nr:glycosyltransferase [Deltaproteobacteria bacterium]MBT4264558.1 glycosyltransferase [Deltaproteobacteria bacterium]MBT6499585.1 glycosyltransferase [Deltaproteobacteria bacterium]MBT7153219.1 glycosyltransferase [Deltaproteobacteria bacterium]MBT7712654.1 glycosyltransferase [Deltaproteobacteria bacterium]
MAAVDPESAEMVADVSGLKVAIVHYWLVTWRGGEKVLESLLKLFPDADIYTLFYEKTVCQPYLKNNRVYTSCLDHVWLKSHYQMMFPFYPLGIRSLKLQKQYDLIISSESGPAKGIDNPDHTPHLCYIHTPMRYCWGFTQTYVDKIPRWLQRVARWRFNKLKQWDKTTIENVDSYVANSRNVAERVQRYYGKTAAICYPPIALELFDHDLVDNSKDYYLSFGAITPYKNIDLLIETFNQLDRKLIVIGNGSEKTRLEQSAKGNIEFKGALPMSDVIQYIRNARALLFPGEEDFGMVPLEVMSQGVPVIAYRKGGALETVTEVLDQPEKSTGLFFDEHTVLSLTDVIRRFESLEGYFDPGFIKDHARQFGEDHFLSVMSGHIRKLLDRSGVAQTDRLK